MYMNPLSSDLRALAKSQVERISKNWWLLLLLGIISFIAGVIILSSYWTFWQLAVFIGLLLIIRGVIQAVNSVNDRSSQSWNLIVGGLSIVAGILTIISPVISLLTIAIVVAVWLLFSGVVDIVGSITNRKLYPYWWLVLIRGLIAVPLGIWALYRPGLSLFLIIFAVGIWAITIGVVEILLSFEIRRLPRTLSDMGPQVAPGMA